HPRRSVSHLITHLLPRHTAPVALLRTNHSFNYPCYFFFNDTATTEIYTLSLHDALPIWWCCWARRVVGARIAACLPAWTALKVRSEEHTSELQSRENLVCRLLLEKKKRYRPHKSANLRRG